jgi:prepilin peptidase CpaA
VSTGAIILESSSADVRPAIVAWSVAGTLASALVGAGVLGSIPIPVLACVSAFLFLAVASDVRCHRVPNLLTLPALAAALVCSPWYGGAGGPAGAVAGAALGFGLLVGPYAVGGVGAGDVKALMALGAWLGPAETLGAAGSLGLLLLALRGELAVFARRWVRILVASLGLRRVAYEPPPAGSAASRGIPFAAALALGLAAQWWRGAPW